MELRLSFLVPPSHPCTGYSLLPRHLRDITLCSLKTTESLANFEDRTCDHFEAISYAASSSEPRTVLVIANVRAFHVEMTTLITKRPVVLELLAPGAATVTAAISQLLGWRTVDSKSEQISGLAEIRIPFLVNDEIHQYNDVDNDGREKNEVERLLIVLAATAGILLCPDGGVEPLSLTRR